MTFDLTGTHDKYRKNRRTRDSGFAWQPHGRGRSVPGRWQRRTRRRAVRRFHRRARGRRAPGRRRALRRQGRARRRRPCQRRDPRRGRRAGGARPARRRRRADLPRRHRRQGSPRRQRHPRHLPRHRQGGGRRARARAVPLRRRRQRPRPARADDECHQRRQTCRQHHRPAGVHDRAVRSGKVLRGVAHGRRGLSHAEKSSQGSRLLHRGRR